MDGSFAALGTEKVDWLACYNTNLEGGRLVVPSVVLVRQIVSALNQHGFFLTRMDYDEGWNKPQRKALAASTNPGKPY